MILYHGSPKKFVSFRTPTGRDELDVTTGGVIYLTSDKEVARKYAGKDGFICILNIKEGTKGVVPYKLQRELQKLPKKHNKYLRGVYVATPSTANSLTKTWEKA